MTIGAVDWGSGLTCVALHSTTSTLLIIKVYSGVTHSLLLFFLSGFGVPYPAQKVGYNRSLEYNLQLVDSGPDFSS